MEQIITNLDNKKWTHINRYSYDNISTAISELNSARTVIQRALDDAYDKALTEWLENPDLIDNVLDMRITPGYNQDIIDTMTRTIVNTVNANIN